MGDLSENFSLSEFLCKCGMCDPAKLPPPSPELISALQRVRTHYGQPMRITSGVRCEAHNAAAGGIPGSAHTLGHAVDIEVLNSRERYDLLCLAFKSDVTRIGIARTFLHLDTSPSHARYVAWVYGDR